MVHAPIVVPGIDPDAPQELHERFTKLEEETAQLARACAEFNAEEERLRETPLSAAGVVSASNGIAEGRADLLAVELGILHRCAQLFEDHQLALAARRRDAFNDCEKAKANLRAKLLKIGYLDEVRFPLDPGRILPGMILQHPDIREARGRADRIEGRLSDNSFRQVNAAAVARLEACIRAMRERRLST